MPRAVEPRCFTLVFERSNPVPGLAGALMAMDGALGRARRWARVVARELIGWLEYVPGRREILGLRCGLLLLRPRGHVDVFSKGLLPAGLWVACKQNILIFVFFTSC